MLQKKEQLELERQILDKTDLLIETLIETSMLVGDERERKLEASATIVYDMAVLLKEYLGGHPEHFETLLRELTRQKLPDENVLGSFGDFNACLDYAITSGLELYQNSVSEDSEEEFVEESPEEIVEDVSVETNDLNVQPEHTLEAIEEEQAVSESMAPPVVEDENQEEISRETVESPADMAVEADNLVGEPGSESPPIIETVEFADENGDFSVQSEDTIPIANNETNGYQDYWDLALRQVFPDTSITKDYSHKGITFSYFLPERAIAIDLVPSDKREAVWKEYYCKQEQIKLISIPALENPRPRQIVRTLKRSLAQNAIQFA
ncbi:MAG: hypothetical protein GX262_05180 [Clostridia bacterium]|nr:hypothetical protein [Clostridia bacterium]